MRGTAGVALLLLMLANHWSFARGPDYPILGAPVLGSVPGTAQLPLTNCTDTNFWYVIQTSTDPTNWVPFSTNFATSPSVPIAVAATNPHTFYQLMTVPHTPIPMFQFAIMTISNLNFNGLFCIVDSFDSSDPLYSTGGQFDSTKRKANANVGTSSSVIGAINIGNGKVYGRSLTGPGTKQNCIQIGPHGGVGDLAFIGMGYGGIETGHWSGDFYLNVPDVAAPLLPGTLTNLPAPVAGLVNLPAGNYTVLPNDPNIGAPLNVTGPATVWVQGSYSPPGITIASTNFASLALYVGTTNGTGDSLRLGNKFNQPGYSANLQFYGLPSVTSINLDSVQGFNGTIYAPEATVACGNVPSVNVSGAMIVQRITANGYFFYHYDESLLTNGPVF